MVSINFSGSRSSISISKTSISANCLNRTALPSITGLAPSGPMLPSPSTAVPLEITPTRLARAVSSDAAAGFATISSQAAATPGEESVTASALPSIRSLGTALGAAVSGVLSTMAGLGDATSAEAVGPAITFVYGANMIPIAVAAIFMFMLLRPGMAKGASGAHATAGDQK